MASLFTNFYVKDYLTLTRTFSCPANRKQHIFTEIPGLFQLGYKFDKSGYLGK